VVALDLDGTLIDARARQVGVAAESVLELTGEQLDRVAFWRRKRGGASTRQALEQLGYRSSTALALARRWSERIESDEWLARDRALDGAGRVLSDLRRAGVAGVVLTARRDPQGARLSLRSAGLDDLVDHVIVVDPDGAVDGKARALRRCAAAWFVGDTESDGAAAHRAGVPFAALATGQRSGAYLRGLGYEPARSLPDALDRVLSATAAAARICL
jgi:phosphoglycolate phosphatase-like HAD superfamily hydrolase